MVGGGWCEIIEFRRVGGGGGDTLEFSLVDAGEPVVTMNLRDFSCSLALVGGGENGGILKLWRGGRWWSNIGIMEVVGGGWSEIIEFRRVGGCGGDTLEVGGLSYDLN